MSGISVLLVDGQSPFALSVVRCLTAVGNVRVHILSTSSCLPLRAARHVSSFRTWCGFEGPNAVEACAAVARDVRADLCMAVDESAIQALVRNAKQFPVPLAPLPSPPGLTQVIDKWHFAKFLRSRGLPHPVTVLCVADAESRERMYRLAYPVLIKPRRGGNGVGIRRFDDPASLVKHLDTYPELWGTTLAQSFVAGQDIDCSVLCLNGRILAHTIQRGFTPAVGFKAPSSIEFVHDSRVLEIVRMTVAELKWTGVAR